MTSNQSTHFQNTKDGEWPKSSVTICGLTSATFVTEGDVANYHLMDDEDG